jgi:hypothetical protein
MPGFWPGFLALDRRTGGGGGGGGGVGGDQGGGGGGVEQYSFTSHSRPCIKNPMYFKHHVLNIPYIKIPMLLNIPHE